MKKSTLLYLILALLAVCCVTAAFAAAPMEPVPDPEPAVTEPAENTEPALAADEVLRAASEQMTADLEAYETLRAELEQMMADLEQELKCKSASLIAQSDGALTEEVRLGHLERSFRELYEMRLRTSGTPVDSALQSICTHPVKERSGYHYSYYAQDSRTHKKITSADVTCRDCKAYLALDILSNETESHSLAEVYVGSNHLGADPSQHYLTFKRQCSLCPYNGTYTVPAGCRGGNCVDYNSLMPEPEIASVSPCLA